MRTITATEFKAKCLKILDEVHETGEVVRITKHGKVVAEVIAHQDPRPATLGFARHLIVQIGDVISPIDVEWEALKDAD